MARGDVAQKLQEARSGRNAAAIGEQGLTDDSGDFRGVRGEEPLQRLPIVPLRHQHGVVRALSGAVGTGASPALNCSRAGW
jgi:hypothetical protein